MGSYTQYITEKGDELITGAISGDELKFTKIVISTAVVSGTEEQIRKLTELSEIKKEKVPDAAEIINNQEVMVQAAFTNEDVTQDFLVQTVGLYAKTGDNPEVLFDIAVAKEPSKMTAVSETSLHTLLFKFNLRIQQADKITIEIMSGGSLPSEIFYGTIRIMLDASLMQEAFYETFSNLESDANALSYSDILKAISTEYGGETSDDPNALSAGQINTALAREYAGESSDDPNALTAAQISEILTEPAEEQTEDELSAAEIAELLS